MITLRKPTGVAIQGYLAKLVDQSFTYPDVGATARQLPAGYVVDHTRVALGQGESVFRAGKAALESWSQFRLGWVQALPENAPLQPGTIVAVVARSLGLWWVNPSRIVYCISEDQDKCGFAYGTLPGHVGSGEERFLVEMDDEEVVWYDILAFSRPQRLLARIGYPYMRRVQRKFGRQSATAMRAAVQDD